MDEHNITIKAYLTPDQWLAFRDYAESIGLSQSSALRRLICAATHQHALKTIAEERRVAICKDRNGFEVGMD
jgi:hypothetical protein